jgi:hypothetical protein
MEDKEKVYVEDFMDEDEEKEHEYKVPYKKYVAKETFEEKKNAFDIQKALDKFVLK